MKSSKIPLAMQSPNREAIEAAVRCLKSGSTLIYPTDTIYGIGCDAFSPGAAARVRELKGRADVKPFLLLIPEARWVAQLARQILPAFYSLAGTFWPGPLTLVVAAATCLGPEVLGEGQTVGLRWAKMPFLEALLGEFRRPIVSTSVNFAGEAPLRDPATEKHPLLEQVDLVLDAGPLRGDESSIIDVSVNPPRLIREGSLTSKVLAAVCPELQIGRTPARLP